jgi:primosomal protein N'
MICSYYVDVEKGYYYDHVFDRTVTNSELFERTMVGPIQNALNGFNSTVLICGMTGSGKTYTMFGEMEARDGSEEGEGVVFQALGRLFAELRAEQQVKSKLYLSFYEIYNETIRDLLREGGQNLNIVEDLQKGTVINDLCEFPI